MKSLLVAATLLSPNLVTHNGSLMEWTALPDNVVEIRYVQPKPALWPLGVRPGTLLIRGQWNGPVLYATAYVFSPSCGPMPYQVTGTSDSNNVLTLTGLAPLFQLYTCIIVGGTPTVNSLLVFEPAPEKRHN